MSDKYYHERRLLSVMARVGIGVIVLVASVTVALLVVRWRFVAAGSHEYAIGEAFEVAGVSDEHEATLFGYVGNDIFDSYQKHVTWLGTLRVRVDGARVYDSWDAIGFDEALCRELRQKYPDMKHVIMLDLTIKNIDATTRATTGGSDWILSDLFKVVDKRGEVLGGDVFDGMPEGGDIERHMNYFSLGQGEERTYRKGYLIEGSYSEQDSFRFSVGGDFQAHGSFGLNDAVTVDLGVVPHG